MSSAPICTHETNPKKCRDIPCQVARANYYARIEGATLAQVLPRLRRGALENDYRAWLAELLPKHFRSADDAQFAPHHQRFFEWGWKIERGKLPDPSACLWVVNRGGNKSTSAAGLAVALGAMQRRKFGLVITRTEPQGDTHVRRVNSMLLSSNVGKFYPGMAKPEVHEVGKRNVQSAWNRTQLTTGDGWTLQSFSLLAAQRGVGLEEYRPDFIWITDVDDEHDSPGMVDSLLNAFSASVLGTRSADCVTIFDQNLIHRDSALTRILTRKTDVLSDRIEIGPIPAVYEPQYERKHEHWYITKGRASWAGLPLPACEGVLNTVGRTSWEREYQHNVNLPYDDAVYSMFDPVYHVITWAEFARFYGAHDRFSEWKVYGMDGAPRLPNRGYKSMAQDWGNNHKHPCANRWLWWPGERMPLTDSLFFYREMCWPRFPKVEGDDRLGPSPLQVAKAIHKMEKRWDESENMIHRLASHERPEIVKAYERDLPEANVEALDFEQIDTSEAREGILHMQNFLTIIRDELHPFRIDPRTISADTDQYVPSHACGLCRSAHVGAHLVGRPRTFFVVANGQGELYVDSMGQLAVMPAIDETGMARTRDEYPNYRKPDTSEGAEKKDAPKLRDDIIDCDRALIGRVGPQIQPLTAAQRAELWMEQRLPIAAVELLAPEARIYGQMSRDLHLQERIEQEQAKEKSWLQQLDGWES
jgi:hypothetical protein